MSITDDTRSELKPDLGASGRRPWQPLLRRPVVVGTAVAAVVALIVAGALWTEREHGTSTSSSPRTAPITLPAAMIGLPAGPADTDFAAQPDWLALAKAAAPGATVVGRGYGSAKLRRQIRVVVGRADLAGKLEFRWAADSGRLVNSPLGPAHCTQNLKLAPGSPAAIRPTMVLCWRTSATLSAYGVLIDFDHTPKNADGVAVLDTAWRAALTAH